MSHKHYPKWKYHESKPAQVVPHEDAEKALGHGWVDSPAHLDQKSKAPIEPPDLDSVGETSDSISEQIAAPVKAKKAVKKPKKAKKAKEPIPEQAVAAEEEI
jgi:hypothetical protein